MTRLTLGGLRRVRAADVYKAGMLAATLLRMTDGIEFSYRADYLDAGRPPVATALPLTPQPVCTHAGAVPPFFAGFLPEGRALQPASRRQDLR